MKKHKHTRHSPPKPKSSAIVPAVADHPARSILAAVGIRPDRIGKPGCCALCGRGKDDGAEFPPFVVPANCRSCSAEDRHTGTNCPCEEAAFDESRRVDIVCTFCASRRARSQFGGDILAGIRRMRMRGFSDGWRLVVNSRDGSAWSHDLRKLRVIEDLCLYHSAPQNEQPIGLVAGLPFIHATEFGRVMIVRTLDGTQEIHREKVFAVESPDGAPLTLDAIDNPELMPDWPASVRDAVWKWNAAQGWTWWHHISISRADGAMPTYGDLSIVRREFVTTARECYQIFPPEDRFVNLHERCLHLWHCADGQALESDTGRVLPRFEAEVSGQAGRPVKLV